MMSGKDKAAVGKRGAQAEVTRFELGGGTVVFVEPSHTVPLVSFSIALRSGAAHDPQGKEGAYRMMARLLRRGADGMTSQQIDEAVDRLGAEMAVDVSASQASIHAQVIRRNLDAFVELLARILRAPTFADDEFSRLRRESIAELIEARDHDKSLAQVAFRRALFKGHLYERGSSGRISTLEAIQRDDVIAAYKKHFAQGNIVVGFAGDISPDEAKRVTETLVSALPAGSRLADPVPPPPPLVGRHLVFVDKPERTQTQILIGGLGTWPHDPDSVALTVANAVFGGTFTSRLMREVRSKRGWSYGAYSRMAVDRQRHAYSLWTFPAATDAAACIELELDLLGTFIDKGITPRELAFIKKYLVRSYAFEIDTAAKRLHQALDVEILGLPADYYAGHVENTLAVTLEDANRAVQARLSMENLLVTVVGTASELFEGVRAKIPHLASAEVVPFDRD